MPESSSLYDDSPAVEHDEPSAAVTGTDSDGSPTKRRRLLLRTMGQQLRQVRSGLTEDESDTNAFSSSGGNRNGGLFVRNVHNGMSPNEHRKQVHIETPESDAVPGDDDDENGLSGMTKSATKYLWLPGEIKENVPGHGDAFTFDDLLAWTQSYFDEWHPAYPFIHAPSMLKYFEEVSRAGAVDTGDPFMLIMLRSIMSISIHDRRQNRSNLVAVPPILVFQSFNEAINIISLSMLQESSLPSLQAVLAVELFLVTMLRYNAASRISGLAARIAYQLDLHRCPKMTLDAQPSESGLRKRIFWSMYLLDRQICPRLGLPTAIADDITDICYPNHEKHKISADTGHDPRLDFLSFLARNAEIRGSIMAIRSATASALAANTDQKAIALNTKLTKWWNDVEEYLEVNDTATVHNNAILRASHRTILQLLKCESTIALNRSVLATSKSPSSYDAALQNCIGAARSVINTLHSALQAGHSLLWPSSTWALWMSAFIIVHAANESQVANDVAIRFVDRSLPVLQHLSSRGSSWPDACIAAIKGLRKELIEKRNKEKIKSANFSSRPHDKATEVPAWQPDLESDASFSTRRNQSEQNTSSSQSERPGSKPSVSLIIDSAGLHARRTYAASDGQPLSNEQWSTDHHRMPSSITTASPFPNPHNNMMDAHGMTPWTGDLMWNVQNQNLGSNASDWTATDLFYGSDIPFWLGDDQAMELGFHPT